MVWQRQTGQGTRVRLAATTPGVSGAFLDEATRLATNAFALQAGQTWSEPPVRAWWLGAGRDRGGQEPYLDRLGFTPEQLIQRHQAGRRHRKWWLCFDGTKRPDVGCEMVGFDNAAGAGLDGIWQRDASINSWLLAANCGGQCRLCAGNDGHVLLLFNQRLRWSSRVSV